MNITRYTRQFSAVILALSGFGLTQQLASGSPGPETQETVITQISENRGITEESMYGQDGIIWVQLYPNYTEAVLVNGKPMGGYYDAVSGLHHSEDRLQWIFITRRHKKYVLVINGRDVTSAYDGFTEPFVNSQGRFAVGARKGQKWRIVLDGQESGAEYDALTPAGINPSGTHYFALGRRNNKWVAILDGKEFGSEVDEASPLWWWEAGHTVALVKLNHRWTWLIDGQSGPTFEVVSMPEFTPDGEHYTYAGATNASGQITGSIVLDGKIVVSNAGVHVSTNWLTRKELRPGVTMFSASDLGVSDPKIADDGTLIYSLRKGEKQIAVLWNGIPGPEFEAILSQILMTHDGKHIAYLGKKGDELLEVRDQKIGPSFPADSAATFVSWISLSEDGNHLAYDIVRGGWFFKVHGGSSRARHRVVVDGHDREYNEWSADWFQFSPHATHYFYYIFAAALRSWIVFDGVDGPNYDLIVHDSLRFLDERTIQYFAHKGNNFIRVTEKLK